MIFSYILMDYTVRTVESCLFNCSDVPCASTSTSMRRPMRLNGEGSSSLGTFLGEEVDPDLQMAIERSMRESVSSSGSGEGGKMRMDSTSMQLIKRLVADKQKDVAADNVLNQDGDVKFAAVSDKCGKVLLKDAGKATPSSSTNTKHDPSQNDRQPHTEQ